MRIRPTTSDQERHEAVALAARASDQDPADAAFQAAIRRDGLLHECRRAWATDWVGPPELGALVASTRRPGAARYVVWRSDGALHIELAHGAVTVRAAAREPAAARQLVELARHEMPLAARGG